MFYSKMLSGLRSTRPENVSRCVKWNSVTKQQFSNAETVELNLFKCGNAKNICELRHVLSETSIRDADCMQFSVTSKANNALPTDFLHKYVFRNQSIVTRVQKRVSQPLSAQRKRFIMPPACKHQLKK